MSLIKENSKVIDLNQFACEHELYDKFTQSEDYESILLDIKKLCPIVADLIENQ